MRYVGCKRRLLPFIHNTMKNNHIAGKTFCDLFAGTATVGQYFKQLGFKIISNDLLYASYIMQQVKVAINNMPYFENIIAYLNLKIKSHAPECGAQSVIDYLNELPGQEGFVYRHYSVGGTQDQEVTRIYFMDDNAKKIDAIRETLKNWKQNNLINDAEFYILLYALLEEVSNRVNTTGTMDAFLKKFQPRSLKNFQLKLPEISVDAVANQAHQVFCQDSLSLLSQIQGVDVLYLDPPYTSKQYASAYHLLETIARWDCPNLKGIAGKRNTQNLISIFNQKAHVLTGIKRVVESRCYRHLLLSYSSDGIVSHETLLSLLKDYGDVAVSACVLPRYNSFSASDPRFKSNKQVEERLYYLQAE